MACARCVLAICVICSPLATAVRCGAGALDDAREHLAPARPGPPCDVLRRMRASLPEDMVRRVAELAPVRYRVATLSPSAATVTLWGRGGARRLLRGHSLGVTGFVFFPLGDRALSWSTDGRAIIWDVATGGAFRQLHHWSPVVCARVFPRGDRIVTCSEADACVIRDAAYGSPLVTLPVWDVRGVEVLPRGDRVLTFAPRGAVAVWDAATGAKRCEQGSHGGTVLVARVFPDGETVVTGGSDSRAIVWDASTCLIRHALPHTCRVPGVAVVGHGSAVVTTSISGGLYTWNASTGLPLRVDPGQSTWRMDSVRVEALGARHDLIVSTTLEEVRVMNVTSGAVLHRMVETPDITVAACVPPAGDIIATLGVHNISVWDVASGAKLESMAHSRLQSTDIAVGLGSVLDPDGFGPGVSWKDLPEM